MGDCRLKYNRKNSSKKRVHILTKKKEVRNEKKDAIERGKQLARKTLEQIKPIDLRNE